MSQWNQILREENYSSEEPDDFVVRFVCPLQRRNIRILDLGCGAGRHVVYAAAEGFAVYGVDTSEMGLKMTRGRLRNRNLHGHLVKCSMMFLPFVESCFDIVVCTRAIYHQKLGYIQNTVHEIHRVLMENGVVLVDFLSKRTYSYGKGSKIEDNTFMECRGTEKDVIHHFADKKELKKLFENFRIGSIKLREKTIDGKLRSRLIVQATK
jgi:ubiquinone/menaquinone biosynthesis C-methylase UbiE